MFEIFLGILLTFGLIFTIPFVMYGVFAFLKVIETPEQQNAKAFIYNISITKLSTSILFVLLYSLLVQYISDIWLIYSLIWFFTAMIGEIGDTFKPDYSYKEALIGIISEIIYFPLAGFILSLLFN